MTKTTAIILVINLLINAAFSFWFCLTATSKRKRMAAKYEIEIQNVVLDANRKIDQVHRKLQQMYEDGWNDSQNYFN